jgi:selenocysteine insertion sequence-binding protein 2
MSQAQDDRGGVNNRSGGESYNGASAGPSLRPPYRKRPTAPSTIIPNNNNQHINNTSSEMINSKGRSAVAPTEPTPSETCAGAAKTPKTTASSSPTTKKSRKPPQQLKTISLGDLMKPNSLLASTGNTRPRLQQQLQQRQPPFVPPPCLSVGTTSDLEFPELPKSVVVLRRDDELDATKTVPPTVARSAQPLSANAPIWKWKGDISESNRQGEEKVKQSKRSKQKKKSVKASTTTTITTTEPSNKQANAESFHPKPKLAPAILTTDSNKMLQVGLQDPTRRTTSGQEFMKLIPSTTTITKGRQRVKPRKKKFTTLKKKVLQERLNKWRDMHPIDEKSEGVTENMGSMEQPKMTKVKEVNSVCLYGFVHPDDDQVDDDDEYEELLSNLRDMAHKVGPTKEVFIPRRKEYYNDNNKYPVFVCFETSRDAAAATSCWNGLVLAGQSLQVMPLHTCVPDMGSDVDREEEWYKALVSKESVEATIGNPSDSVAPLVVMVLENFLTEDDLEDPDCLEETINDARALVEPFAKIIHLKAASENSEWLEVTLECDEPTAKAVAAKLNEVVVGGTHLLARVKKESPTSHATTNKKSTHLVELANVLSTEDFEDEDGLQESLDDIRSLAAQFGVITDVRIYQEKCLVSIAYDGNLEVLENAAKHLDGMMLGGSKISARVVSDPDEVANGKAAVQPSSIILLANILTEDDMEDEDCLQESLNDIRELAMKFGKVVDVTMDQSDVAAKVRVTYDGSIEVANKAVSGFNGMLVGGQKVVATRLLVPVDHQESKDIATSGTTAGACSDSALPDGNAVTEMTVAPELDSTQFSGGKRIPERFAECKRVPKIPNAGTPRHYAKVTNDEGTKTLLHEMLEELTRLQRRAAEDKNTKARRRLVLGLREVARGIRAHKVKMVVMANNLDEYGAIDEKLQSILDLATAEEVPIFFEFGKRALGKAVGKTIKVGVVGIQNSDGADQQFKKLTALSRKLEYLPAVTLQNQINELGAGEKTLQSNH